MKIQKLAISCVLLSSLCFGPTQLRALEQLPYKQNKVRVWDKKYDKPKANKPQVNKPKVNKLNDNECPPPHHSSSSSSSSSTHRHRSHHSCPSCKPPVKITHVPYTIRKDGKYCVDRDLLYNGSSAAITIVASNVNLNFNNHNLTITDPNASGILIDGQSEIDIENDAISYTTRSSVDGTAAIKILNSEKVSVDNILMHNAFDGIFAQNSSDIRVTKSRWTECFGSALHCDTCRSVFVEDSTSENTADDFLRAGIFIGANSQGIYFNTLSLHNTDIFLTTGRDAIIENSNIFIDDPNYPFTGLQFGSTADQTAFWEQAIVRNCTISVLPGAGTNTSANASAITRASGILYENCLLECNTGGVEGGESAVLSIGANLPAFQQQADCHNVRIVNCVLQNLGQTQFGVLVDATTDAPNSGIVLDDCSVAGAIVADVKVAHTESSVIKNSNITDSFGDGIVFGDNALSNSLMQNTISNNCSRAIYLGSGSTNNIVQNNTILHNGDDIINDGTNNLLIGNTEFSNNLVCDAAS